MMRGSMPLSRVLEPEVMDTAEEAADYDAMDHDGVNRAFCDDLLAEGPNLARTLDVGTGTALIPIALCRVAPAAHVLALDMAGHMLALARRNVDAAGLAARIVVEPRDAKATGLASGTFDTVISNSLVHHVPDTRGLFAELARLVAPGGLLFVRDLVRPADETELAQLVARYAPVDGGSAAVAMQQRQRALFDASLHAALSKEEVMRAAQSVNMQTARVAKTSDRHLTLVWRRPT